MTRFSCLKVTLLLLLCGLVNRENAEAARLDPFDRLIATLRSIKDVIQDFAPFLSHRRLNNENDPDSRFKEYALHDQSNEVLGNFTMQQIVARSGFKYKDYLVTADDGYITQLTRIINPLADPAQLKQPPIMMMHGGIIDPTAYVWASAIQHHPEPYPRVADSGPMTSWNRSLAFMLVNNGYDVWLVGTRGSDSQNQHHVEYKGPKSIDQSGQSVNEPISKSKVNAQKYWNFTMDDVIQYEIPKQIDKILELTGARNLTLFVFSLSSMTGPPFLAANPDYAAKVHNMIIMAPIINNKGANKFIKTMHNLLTTIPEKLGIKLLTENVFTRPLRMFNLLMNSDRYTRYTSVKSWASLWTGTSAKYNTLLEPAVTGHLFMQVGFKYLRHYSQQVKSSRLQKFDYGFAKNLQVYADSKPPIRSIANINVKNWLLVSASNDNLATPESVKQYLNDVGPKPYSHIIAPLFSHLDLIAGFTNAEHVNMPVLKFLNEFHLPPSSSRLD